MPILAGELFHKWMCVDCPIGMSKRFRYREVDSEWHGHVVIRVQKKSGRNTGDNGLMLRANAIASNGRSRATKRGLPREIVPLVQGVKSTALGRMGH